MLISILLIGGENLIFLFVVIGPYDELLWAPGVFQDPRHDKPVKRYRITRIYVSSLDSVYNGANPISRIDRVENANSEHRPKELEYTKDREHPQSLLD